MAVSLGDRGARGALALVSGALLAATLALDLPRASRGEFWGDGATYYAMAWSLARDFDLRFEERDLARIRREYPGGPQGIFLKRAHGGLTLDPASGFPWLRRVRPEEGRLYFAKALAHPLAVAPLVALAGTRGLTLANGLLLSAVLWLAFGMLRRRGMPAGASLALTLAFFLLTVAPVYLVWPTPEIFGMALVCGGLWAWAAERPVLSAVLFGVAGYVKPPNLLMAAPLGLDPLLPKPGERWLGPGLLARAAEALRRGALVALCAGIGYGANAALTGEINYQGGERKTFYGRFPFDETGAGFDDAGIWMTTNQVGPLVAGRDDDQVSEASGPARDPREIRQSFLLNLGYFWIGRFGGALAYFLPAVLALALFLLRGPRGRAGWLALVSIVVSWLAYIWVIPDNWYGGGGAVGNRYFLSVLPAFVFLVPRQRGLWLGAAAAVWAALVLSPLLSSPIRCSLAPGSHTRGIGFRALPAELTMLNDLSVFTEPWRKKRGFGFTGNAARHADAEAYFLYFMDDGSWGREERGGRPGLWLRAGASAELVVRAFDIAAVDRIVVRVTGGPRGDQVTARLGLRSARVSVGPGEQRELELPAGSAVRYYDTFLHVLRLRSRRGAALPDGRPVGAFVELRLVTRPWAAATAP